LTRSEEGIALDRGMTYRFELERKFPHAPSYDRDGSASIEFALGYDPERDTVVVMSTLLVTGDSYMQGKMLGLYDLQFGIRERNLATHQITPPDFSSVSASKYIPRTFRGEVMTILLEAVEALVHAVDPQHLTMETYYGHLPPQALEKYVLISGTLERAGYRLQDRFRADVSGIEYWLFSKADIATLSPNR
jgi:hypothetical protein